VLNSTFSQSVINENLSQTNQRQTSRLFMFTVGDVELLLISVRRTILTLSVKAFIVRAIWKSLSYNCRSAGLLSAFERYFDLIEQICQVMPFQSGIIVCGISKLFHYIMLRDITVFNAQQQWYWIGFSTFSQFWGDSTNIMEHISTMFMSI